MPLCALPPIHLPYSSSAACLRAHSPQCHQLQRLQQMQETRQQAVVMLLTLVLRWMTIWSSTCRRRGRSPALGGRPGTSQLHHSNSSSRDGSRGSSSRSSPCRLRMQQMLLG